MISLSRLTPLLASSRAERTPAPNPALLQRILASRKGSTIIPQASYATVGDAGLFGGPAELPGNPGPADPDPGALPGSDLPNDFFGPIVQMNPPAPRDPGGSGGGGVTVYGNGPASGFGSVAVPGGFGPPDANWSGTPSLFDTTWTNDKDLGWVPRAQAIERDKTWAYGLPGKDKQKTRRKT